MSNTFEVGALVTITHPKTKQRMPALVTKVTKKNLRFTIEGANGELRGWDSAGTGLPPEKLSEALKAAHGTAVPVGKALQDKRASLLQPSVKHKRGDVVSYEWEGEQCTGRVVKGGKRPEVSHYSGCHIAGPANSFAPAKAPVIATDAALSDWTVASNRQQGMGMDCPRYTAHVAYRGVVAFQAICDGDGGELRYEPVGSEGNHLIQQFIETVNQYVKDKGGDSMMADELWIEYAWDLSHTGLSFIEYLNRD